MSRKGFTLVEVLVILAILSALAAVLVPTVTNQVRKADINRVTGDLTNLRTGVEAFLVNVHRYPGDMEDLVFPIQTDGTDTDINAQNYSTGLAANWEGPYIDRAITDGGTLETGFGGLIHDDFAAETLNSVSFLRVTITGIDTVEFALIDANIDEGNGPAEGRLHWTDGGVDPDTIHFYALPIN